MSNGLEIIVFDACHNTTKRVMRRMVRKRKQPIQSEAMSTYDPIFRKFFEEFESSGFDTVALTELDKRLFKSNRQRAWYAALDEEFDSKDATCPVAIWPDGTTTKYRIDEHEARRRIDELLAESPPHLVAIGPDRFRKCGDGQPIADYYVERRLFLEYALRRIPKSDTILRELLLERVRHAWHQQRSDSEHEHQAKLLKQLKDVLHGTVSHAVSSAFYELRAYGVIAPDTSRVEITEGGDLIFPEESSDGNYQFGTVRNHVLKWTAPLHQLARAIHEIEPYLGYEAMTAYAICKNIEKTGSVVLGRGKFESVKKYLEQIYRRDPPFAKEAYVPEAARIILSLLKQR